MNIRRATPSDATAIAAIIVPIIREGTTYTLDPDMSEQEALAYVRGNVSIWIEVEFYNRGQTKASLNYL
jgi:hypothetical protein